MNEVWLSETSVPDASTAILFGPISEKTIGEECMHYPKGVLWIAPTETEPAMTEQFPTLIIARCTDSADSIMEAIRHVLGIEYDKQPVVKASRGTETNSQELYSAILEMIISEIDSTFRSRKTRNEVGYQRQFQVFENLCGYLNGRVPEEWRDLAENSLAVVVGAGPSLDQTLPLLKEGFPKPVVIAADSSLRALRSAGVDPDFVVSIDAEKTYDSCSEAGYAPGMAILSSQSHGSWRGKWTKKCRFLSGRVLTEDWLAEKGIAKTKLQAVNNAGLTALLFADFLGPAGIILIGMDLAGGGKGDERYAESTGRSHMQIHTGHFHKVPGNFEPGVPTPFLSDWQETSELTAEVSQRRLIVNLNDRGAQLKGATVIHPKDIKELRNAISENLVPFELSGEDLLSKRRAVQGNGMKQILTQLANRCDRAWDGFPNKEGSCRERNDYVKTLFTDRDMASLLGDFSFTVLPRIASDTPIGKKELELAVDQLQNLIWRLEDAILECEPDEQLLIRFLTEKFN
jgi:hypothetical protein